ncbi:hypothetical protein [Streptomyces sp. UNOB3_S3]|uniref:ATP-binding protein n=1 Tax=Streptomyces sp. UNOB3_S3 TaxID=2871682 RepID=UPI001E3191E1|nr:hypothetical protein [Streptomyces sp. UNOB3_S3]MCC3774607.1 hypothetical protein [Streptomyces sp. UNOB3_S3]
MRTATLRSPGTTCAITAGTEAYRFVTPATLPSVRVARDVVRAVLAATASPLSATLIEDARLCVSDAVTYMIPRILGPLAVEITLLPPHLVVAVGTDNPHGAPVEYGRRPDDHPRLTLLRRLGAASGVTWTWGAGHEVVGKRVWFELHDADAWLPEAVPWP